MRPWNAPFATPATLAPYAQPVRHFFDQTPESLGDFAAAHRLPRFFPKQILRWVYERGVVDPAQMTDLSKLAREIVAREITFLRGEVNAHQVATDGTQKLLVEWTADSSAQPALRPPSEPLAELGRSLPLLTPAVAGIGGAGAVRQGERARRTECVMIPTESRKTACVSSQVGCPVGCAFCASGIGGLEGNLTRGQIVEQVWRLGRLPEVGRISNVVFMGMGEPLANLAAVTDAIRTMNAEWGLGISARRITVSTVGLPAAIRRLCAFELPVTLALSLHAPNDEIRRTIIPWAEYATIDELLDACEEWFRKTGREITLEYILLGGVNDFPAHARELASVAKRLRANVNLIRYNEVRGMPFQRPATQDVRDFQEILRMLGVNTHVRRSRGRDIAAACGQLRHEKSARAAG
jgi:23S rRNA (adenine2503-C2)-methyltransferase